MNTDQALDILRQLCARPTTQINGLAEAKAISEALAVMDALVKSKGQSPAM